MIGVVDYGCGNPGSVVSMLRRINVPVIRITKPEQFDDCERFILPGVGAFDDVVLRFRASGFEAPLTKRVRTERAPLLGICVGMQMLADCSEEGVEPGLGWIPGKVRHLSRLVPDGIRLPVMGWQYIEQRAESFVQIREETRFYFVHSYYFEVGTGSELVYVSSSPGAAPAAVRLANIFGTQFHPEKSHHFGMELLASFSKWVPVDADV